MDGQIYLLAYGLDGEGANAHAQFDFIVAHVRDAFTAPELPSWIPDIAPIFTQYGNLYPIMSQRLVDLSDPASVMANLKLLQLAFSLDIGDANYMPVTRDLSQAKRTAIQRWLRRLEVSTDPSFVGGARPPPARVPKATAEALAGPAPEPLGGKTTFANSLRASRRD